MFKIISKKFKYGNHYITLESGILARRSDSSIIAKMGDTVVLITIVKNDLKIYNKFLPLTINYYERSYSIGKFPGGFLKREIRQTDNEIIISRLIDRSIRPLLYKYYPYEIQITITAISIDKDIFTDILSIIGVSAALGISDIPFNGPVSSCRVGFLNNEFILNPSFNELKNSDLDMIVSVTKNSIIMIESSSNFVSEDLIIRSIDFAINNQINIIDDIKSFYNSNDKNNIYLNKNTCYLYELVKYFSYEKINYLYKNLYDKNLIKQELYSIKNETILNINKLTNLLNTNNNIENSFDNLVKYIIRDKILKTKIRIDKRNKDDIRDIYSEISVLPRAHGSSIFIRGETQSLVSVTLGNEKNLQNNENLFCDENFIDNLIFHYNFPPYCVGEIGSQGFPKRREIGHGRLAKKSILPIIPNINDFPYTIRIVSEITESNGSSSMASVCGASLALMDAGVPIKSIVVGVAMGIIINNKNSIILTDISGDEDFFGDIDLKVAGNEDNITSLQMDTKSNNIKINIIKDMLCEAKTARIKIINKIKCTISIHKSSISKFVPRIKILNIDKDKIKYLIGKGGSTIKNLIGNTKSIIDINNDGIVKISSINKKIENEIIEKINKITEDIYIGKIMLGIVSKISNLGVFFNINNKEGLVNKYYLNKNNYDINNFIIGKKLYVKVVNIDKLGRIILIMNNYKNI